ncbi:MAG: dethiobiotin synthase [Coxiellaceae bacterium]|nr:MAG: dethiobiotin synthase [Coxiellaceae bacterium]
MGKTLVSAALLYLFKRSGLQTLALKPVATGCDDDLISPDAILLKQYATLPLSLKAMNPCAFAPPVSPNLLSNTLCVNEIIKLCEIPLSCAYDVALIEGIGGWSVPLNSNETMADFAVALQFPVILVVGVRLGCLNHSLLTLAHMRMKQINLVGWVANIIQEEMLYIDENIAALKSYMPAPLLGVIPFTPDITLKWQQIICLTSLH